MSGAGTRTVEVPAGESTTSLQLCERGAGGGTGRGRESDESERGDGPPVVEPVAHSELFADE